MSKGGYKIFDQGGLYYVSFAVVAWVDVFTRKDYRDNSNRKFTALPEGKRISNLWMVHYEQSCSLNYFSKRK